MKGGQDINSADLWKYCKDDKKGAASYCMNQENATYDNCKLVNQNSIYCRNNKKATVQQCGNNMDDLYDFCLGPNAITKDCQDTIVNSELYGDFNPRSNYCRNNSKINSLEWTECQSTKGTTSNSSYESPSFYFCGHAKNATYDKCASTSNGAANFCHNNDVADKAELSKCTKEKR